MKTSLTKLLVFIFLSINVLLFADNYIVVPDSSKAEVIKLAKPEFPDNLRIKKQIVEIQLLIKEDGSFEILHMPESANDISMYIIDALNKSIFTPAYKNKETVAEELVVIFEIENNQPNIFDKLFMKKKGIDPDTLKIQIENYIERNIAEKDKSYYNNFYYPVNVYPKGLLYHNQIIKKNGFISNYNNKNLNLLYQNNINLYHFEENKINITNIHTQNYPEQVMLISADLAMAENNISFANVKAEKNHVFNIENLLFESSFLAYQGEVPQINESAAIMRNSVSYKRNGFNVNIGYENHDHDYSSERLNNYYFANGIEDLINEKSYESWALGSYKNLFLGYNKVHEKQSVSSMQKIDFQSKSYLLGIQLPKPLFNNKFDLFWQYYTKDLNTDLDSISYNKEVNSLLGVNHNFNKGILSFDNEFIYDAKNSEKQLSSKADITFMKHYALGVSFYNNSFNSIFNKNLFVNQNVKNQIGINLAMNWAQSNSEIVIGNRKQSQTLYYDNMYSQEESYAFVTLKNNISIPYSLYTLNMRQLLEYQNTDILHYEPRFLNKTQIAIKRDFHRDNYVTLGVDTYFADQVITKTAISERSFITDIFAKIQITKLFDITIKAHNITNEGSYLAEEINLMQFSGQIRWNFLN